MVETAIRAFNENYPKHGMRETFMAVYNAMIADAPTEDTHAELIRMQKILGMCEHNGEIIIATERGVWRRTPEGFKPIPLINEPTPPSPATPEPPPGQSEKA